MTKLQQKINKVAAIMIVLAFVVAGSVFARTANDDPSNLPTLSVSNQYDNNWKTSRHIGVSDTALHFDIHYYAWHEGAQNMRAHMNNLDGKIYHKGDTANFSAYVKSDNLSRSNGSASVTFDKDVKLKLFYTSDRRNHCDTRACQKGSANSVFNSNGINLGNFPAHNDSNYYGNVIIVYTFENVGGNNSNKVDGGWTTPWTKKGEGNCNNGRKKILYARTCTNPTPANGGAQCSGNSTKVEYENCNNPNPGNGDVDTNSPSSIGRYSVRLNGDTDGTPVGDVWFAFSRTDSSPSCSDSGQRINATKSGNSFYVDQNGLSCNTEYYVRACGRDSNDNDLLSGSIEHFTTDSCRSSHRDGDVDTNSATSVDEDSARLNGDVEDADVNEVWFAFSRTDHTPSCDSSSQREDARGGTDEGDDFYAYVRNLRSNTKYYFRACGEDENGNDIQGSVRSFTTDSSSSSNEDAKVYTNSATSIAKYSAQLNGYVDINDTENGKVYFVYGPNTSMIHKTGDLRVISNTTFQSITNLTPNTKYYFQAIIKDNDGIVDRGIVRTFWTKSSSIPITLVNGKCGYVVNSCIRGTYSHVRDTSTKRLWNCKGLNGGYTAGCSLRKIKPTPGPNPAPKPKPIEVVVVEKTVVTQEVTNTVKINKWVSHNKYKGYKTEITANAGDTVFYKVKVINNTDARVENVKVVDFIPEELDLNNGSTNGVDKYIDYRVTLNAGESKTIITEMKVSEGVENEDIIDSDAKIYLDDKEVNTNNVVIYISDEDATASTTDDENNRTASIFGANSMLFPSTIIGWMALLILVSIFGLLLTKIFTTIKAKE